MGLISPDGIFMYGGALKDNGMASFAAVLNREQVDAIRSYLVSRAHQTKGAEAAAKR